MGGMPKEIKSEQDKRRRMKRVRSKSIEEDGVDTSWHAPFVEAIEQGCPLTEACKKVHIDPKTFQIHRKRFPEFDAEYRECRWIAVEKLKSCLMYRAINGQEDVTIGPDGSETIRRYVDNKLGMYLLTKLCPEEYGDKQEVIQTKKIAVVTEEDILERTNKGFMGILKTLSCSLSAVDLPPELLDAAKNS